MALTGVQKREWQREYLKKYNRENPDKIEEYHRRAVLKRAMHLGRLPASKSIKKYNICPGELEAIAMSIVQRAKASQSVACVPCK